MQAQRVMITAAADGIGKAMARPSQRQAQGFTSAT